MDKKTLNTRIQNKRDIKSNWESNNPVLLKGEFAIVEDGNEIRIKVGDGVTNYNGLPFIDDPLRNQSTSEVVIDLTSEISSVFKEGSWSLTSNVDSANSDIAKYVTRVSLSDIKKEDKNPDVIIRDIDGFEYKGNKRIEMDSIYFYSNSAMPGSLVVDFGNSEIEINISSNVANVMTDGSWSLTNNVDPSHSNIAKYVTRIPFSNVSSNRKLPNVFLKDSDNFVVEAFKRAEYDYIYVYSNFAILGKIILLS